MHNVQECAAFSIARSRDVSGSAPFLDMFCLDRCGVGQIVRQVRMEPDGTLHPGCKCWYWISQFSDTLW